LLISPVSTQDDRLGHILTKLRDASFEAFKKRKEIALFSGLSLTAYFGVRRAILTGICYRRKPYTSLFRPSQNYIDFLLKKLRIDEENEPSSKRVQEGVDTVGLHDWKNNTYWTRIDFGKGEDRYRKTMALLRSFDVSCPTIQFYSKHLKNSANQTTESLYLILNREKIGWTLIPLRAIVSKYDQFLKPREDLGSNRSDVRPLEYSYVCFTGAGALDWPGCLMLRVTKEFNTPPHNNNNVTTNPEGDTNSYLEISVQSNEAEKGISSMDQHMIKIVKQLAEMLKQQVEESIELQRLRSNKFERLLTRERELSTTNGVAPRVRRSHDGRASLSLLKPVERHRHTKFKG